MSKITVYVLILVMAIKVKSAPLKYLGIYKVHSRVNVKFPVTVTINVVNANNHIGENDYFLSLQTESISKCLTGRKQLEAGYTDKITTSVPYNQNTLSATQKALKAVKNNKSQMDKPKATVLHMFDCQRTITKIPPKHALSAIYEIKVLPMSTMKLVTILWNGDEIVAFTKLDKYSPDYYVTGPSKTTIDGRVTYSPSTHARKYDIWTLGSTADVISIDTIQYQFDKYNKYSAGFGILTLKKFIPQKSTT